jgi:hypothetical protein
MTDGSEELHATFLFDADAGWIEALNFAAAPRSSTEGPETRRDEILVPTVTCLDERSFVPSALRAVMTVVPLFFATTLPVRDTDATDGLLDVQRTLLLLALDGRMVTLKALRAPLAIT